MLTLLVAAALAFLLGDHLEAGVIFGLVVLSVALGFAQEYRAQKALEKLANFIRSKSRVKRDGSWLEVDSQTLVVGDVVELRIGDIIPADIRLLEIDGFLANESALTGESLPVIKQKDALAFMGTSVAEGLGRGIVVATAEKTFFGKTAATLAKTAPPTEFQKQTKNFSQFLTKVVVVMTLFVFFANALLAKGILDSFLFAVALAVGITPELLPAIMTITLSEGALKIAKKKVIVKKLMSVEDLGNIDTLCADKTGTLTQGKFSLYDNPDKTLVLKALLFVPSTPLDKALKDSEIAKSQAKQLKSYHVLDENEFDYQRRRVSILVRKGNSKTLLVKGAIEAILSVSKVTKEQKQKVLNEVESFEQKGMRVIGFAEKVLSKTTSTAEDEKDLKFLGYLLFTDPPKSSAAQAIAKLRSLGVDIKILSGDSPLVTAHIAQAVGFDGDKEKVITGEELQKVSGDKFAALVRKTNLFARITPEQKYQIVSSLNQEGHVVGFLGDGVNDAPALKVADVGIAVDSGAAVAKEAADIILLQKDLGVLAEGIEAGRKTFGNIMKYILNTISANFGNMLTVSLSSLFLKFIPLLPSQILLNNFISDIPLFAVATDNVDTDFTRKPKHWNIGTISHFMLYFGLLSSFFDLVTILPMAFVWHLPTDLFRTVWFIESSLSEMFITFTIRTKLPFYKSVPSPLLLVFSLFSSLAVVALPLTLLGQKLFEFAAIPTYLWLWIAIIVGSYFLTVEILKHKFFRKFDL